MDVSEEGGVTLLRYAPCSNSPATAFNSHNSQASAVATAVSRGKEKLLTRLRRRSRSAPRNRTKSEREAPEKDRIAAANHRDSIIYEANGERVKNSEGGSRRKGSRPESVELVGFSTASITSLLPPNSAAQNCPNPISQANHIVQYNTSRRAAGNVPTTNKTSAELKEERKLRNLEMNGGSATVTSGCTRRPSQNSDSKLNGAANNNSLMYQRHFTEYPHPSDSLKSSLKLSASSDLLLAAERERLIAQNRQLLFNQAAAAMGSGFGRSSADIVNQFWKEREERFRRLAHHPHPNFQPPPPHPAYSQHPFYTRGVGEGQLPPHSQSYYNNGGIYPPPPPGYGLGEDLVGGGNVGAFLRGSESKLGGGVSGCMSLSESNNTTTSVTSAKPSGAGTRSLVSHCHNNSEPVTHSSAANDIVSSRLYSAKSEPRLELSYSTNSLPSDANESFCYSSKHYDLGHNSSLLSETSDNGDQVKNNVDTQVNHSTNSSLNSGETATNRPRERIIPIQVLDSPMLPPRRTLPESEQQLAAAQQLPDDSAAANNRQPFDLSNGFPSLFNDLKLSADRHGAANSIFENGGPVGRLSSAANIPAAAFGRLSSNLGLSEDISALRSGIRDSFFGMQSNFGKFPTFGPILPEDSLNLSPHTRRNGGGASAHKKRIQKRHNGAGNGQKAAYRYASSDSMDEPQPHGDNNGHIIMTGGGTAGNLNSETEDSDSDDEENERGHHEDRGIILMEEIEDEELDSVSVVARSTRDRLSGTGSTQSEDSSHHSGGSAVNGGTSEASATSGGACSNSSTLSNDSGIAEEFLHSHNHLRGATRRHNANATTNENSSAVPSELSDVSNLSNLSISSRTSSEHAKYDDISDNYSSENGHQVAAAENSGPAVIPEEGGVPAGSSPAVALPGASDERDKSAQKSYLIAKELLSTEIHYVSKLHLIDQVFHFRLDHENRNLNIVPQDTIQAIFSNIKSIYKFHAEFLLPQLQERMDLWTKSLESPNANSQNEDTKTSDTQPPTKGGDKAPADPRRIGDIMLRYSPFLIMYTEYVKNFDTAMRTINQLYNKNSKFAAIMDTIHGMEECENLSLQHHMLCPVQRIPRYEMLLRDYLNNLPKDSPDRQDSENALKQVSQAAAHANDSMKRIEQFKKLLETQESIGGSLDLVSPTRELIKEGRIVKISARTGDHQDRYLFLLTDLLLLCSPRKSMISGAQYGLRAKFHVENLQVSEGDNLVTANTFYLRDETKSVELYTNTQEEKEEWIQALFFAINSLYTRKSSLRVGRDILRPLECEIGKKKPHLQKLETAVKCAECAAQFSLLKPKHNCRTCGAVFCGKCSDYKHSLSWEDGRKGRVCKSCHVLLTSQLEPQPPGQAIIQRPRGLLEVPAFTASPIRSGWLTLRGPPGGGGGANGSGNKPTKRFFLLLSDFVLYSFKTENDSVALTATPLPGYQVATASELSGQLAFGEKESAERTIRLQHPSRVNKKRVNYFVAETVQDAQRWAEVMKLAAKAELPDNYKDDLYTEDRKSTSSTEYENS